MENSVSFRCNMTAKINFAMQQNYVPVIKNIVVTNNTETELRNVKLRITADPEFIKTYETSPMDLLPSQPVETSALNILLVTEYLFSLTEKISGSITIEAVQDENVIASESRPIELLAYDQWSGMNFMPETIAAFVTPNHPKVQEVISLAGKYLQKWTGEPSFTGYQTRSANMVKQQMGAVYAALQELNLAYCPPPASYEDAQRVRMADTVLEEKKGTCLDLSVLYCSCLESIGLNPLLVLVKGHAMAGCWLEMETFSDSLQYDVTAITKRTAHGIDAMSVVECTAFVAGRATDFDKSEKLAADALSNAADFCFAVDIMRTRSGGIRPVPSKVSENGTFKAVDYGDRKKNEITSAPSELDIIGETVAEDREVTKQVIWERKLLDLSLRNSLLNFRASAMSVQLMSDNLSTLEDEMARDEEFKIMPVPEDMTLTMSDSKIYEIENNKDLISSIAEAEFKSNRLRTFLKETDLEKLMKKLQRQAKVSIEENGANTIYLALGFLRWYETDKSEKPRYAPLVLVPVDIIRKVQDKSYTIKRRDEDTQVNITLLEMLRQFFGIDIKGLDPVPMDESGVDLNLIFSTVRQGIMAKSRWDIEEYAFVGQFSFNRFIMWNDIRNRSEELAQNKVVASLISGKTEWQDDDIYISPLDLDKNVKPSDLAVPLSADSSQLAAVYAASQGKSFVLHGPPGSGKSQTITNMIASALYHGKTVLFVAEKMAALSVVEKRLDKVGLGPFCLELHSNKAQKRAVLKQLEETLNLGKLKQPSEYKSQAEKISEMRSELNGVMDELHKKRNYGYSVYDAAVRYEKEKENCGTLAFTYKQIDTMSENSYAMWRETLEALAAAGREFGDVTSTALSICETESCTPETRGAFEKKLNELKSALRNSDGDRQAMCSFTGMSGMTYAQCRAVAEILTSSDENAVILPDIIDSTKWKNDSEDAAKAISKGKEYSALKEEILSEFEPSVLSYNSSDALVRWKTAESKWALSEYFATKKLVTELSAHAKSKKTVTKENIRKYYDKLNNLTALKTDLDAVNKSVTSKFGNMWNAENTDWSKLEKAVSDSEKLGNIIENAPFDYSVKQSICKSIAENGISKTGADAQGAKKNFDTLESITKSLEDGFKVKTDKLLDGENWTETAVEKADALISELPQLKEWTGIVGICNKLREFGIDNVADAYLSGKIPTDKLVSTFDADLNKSIITAEISRNKVLSGFNGTLFEDTVRRFGEVLDNFTTLTMKELAAELSAKIPTPGNSAGSSEIGILQKAIKSNGRMMSIRKLFDSIPNLLRRMCPCMLMSPISVAQYIDPSYPKFDLVIFDEASQLPTCEAVGAIARGENVIVVGDPKQLPPTSFFSSNQTDEENYEKEDLESVLDDCLALSMPQKHLLWHYRSRHESLIAFSNAKYYENKLYTFPSPDDQISEVSWVHVDGYYDKSSTRTNKAEAQAVVDEICRRLADEELRKLSIGVVTFSLPQQNLVDDLLMDAFRANPQLEQWANEMYEPILIKNLENVQGDERDVIMFTIGYGPDKEGKLSMNFGPLNRDGGWRRLNVAISRSKCKMIVFSVITPDMIDLSRTRSDGVEGLKGFLEFAAKGKNAIAVKAGSQSRNDSFAQVVSAEISKLGYESKCSVGCSDYKIDVAVVNPDKPESYILGINCGSESNYKNGTASDRTLSQPSVLKGLGWNVMNVYMLDWLDNKDKVLARIRSEIEKCVENYRNPKTEKEESKPKQTLVFEKEEEKSFEENFETYEPYKIKVRGKAESFTEENLAKITECINEILEAESPVSKKMLVKKVLESWEISRNTASVKNVFDKALEKSEGITDVFGESEFIWHKAQNKDKYNLCRANSTDENRRAFDDIAPEEIAVGIKRIMERQAAMQREDLLRETAHLFGYTRLTETIETAVSLGIKTAKQRGWVEFSEDGKITYSGE